MSSTPSGKGPSLGSSVGLAADSGLRCPRPSVQVAAPESGKPAALAWRLRLVGLLSVPAALAPVHSDGAGASRPGASAHSFLGSSWEGVGEKNQRGPFIQDTASVSPGPTHRGQRSGGRDLEAPPYLLPNILLSSFHKQPPCPTQTTAWGGACGGPGGRGHPTSWWGWGGPSWVSCLPATPRLPHGCPPSRKRTTLRPEGRPAPGSQPPTVTNSPKFSRHIQRPLHPSPTPISPTASRTLKCPNPVSQSLRHATRLLTR